MHFISTLGFACLILTWTSAADDTNIGTYHLIAGMPSNSEIPTDNFATTLYALDVHRKRLNPVRTITTRQQGSRFVRLYEDLGIGVVASSGKPGTARFDFIDFDQPARVTQVETTAGADKYFPANVMMFDLPDGPLIGICEPIGSVGSKTDPASVRITGFDMAGHEVSLQPEAYFSALSSGSGTGEGVHVPQDAPLVFSESEGRFHMGIPGRLVDVPFDGPDLGALQEKNAIQQVINNRSIRVLTSHEMTTWRDGKKFIDYLIHDKHARSWKTRELERSRFPKAFGPYLAFVMGHDGRETHTGPAVPIPGEPTSFTHSAKTRMEGWVMTGEIVILDAIRGTHASFRVDSGDCDVLLVDRRGDILYRVEDTIFLRRWEGDSVGEPIVLVTDTEIVPAIHWAFQRTRD